MKRFVLAMLALSGLAGFGIWYLASRPARGAAPKNPALVDQSRQAAPIRLNLPAPAPGDGKAAGAPAAPDAPTLPPMRADPDQANQRIDALAGTFDASHSADLAQYLKHPARDVRKHAAHGLMLLGDNSAAAALDAGASKAEAEKDLEIAAAFRHASEYLNSPRNDEPRPKPVSLQEAEQAAAEMSREKSFKQSLRPSQTGSTGG